MAKQLGLRVRIVSGPIRRYSLARCLAQAAACSVVLLAAAGALRADPIQIDITGLNLVYQPGSTNSDIFDDSSANESRTGDPADADPITAAAFYMNGIHQGTIATDVFADVFVNNVPAFQIGTPFNSGGNGGAFGFDLMVDSTSDGDTTADNGLQLDLTTLSFFAPVNGVLTGGGVATIAAQDLAFPGFSVTFDSETVNIAFSSANMVPVISDEQIIGFTWSGTATIFGDGEIVIVPEPATRVLAGLGALAVVAGGAVRRLKRRPLFASELWDANPFA